MNALLDTDKSFPAWLTMSGAWRQSMDDPGDVQIRIARNLVQLRESRGLSQRALAKLAETNLARVKEIETAKAFPDIALIWKLALALDVPCTVLVGGAASK
jgi:ribosome-binding protein aMBF1 (putative translation factor)